MRRILLVALLALMHLGGAALAGEPASAFPDGTARTAGADGAPIVELYTMGQGALVVERFGHAAICVRYPRRPHEDVCYNYGTTDFSDPLGLTWGFVRGDADFWVSTTSPAQMIHHYRAKDRSIWLQRLPLDDATARELAAALEHDALPENRYYQYHHFADNCTTRVRDMIDGAVGGALSGGDQRGPGLTYRDISRQGFAEITGLLLLSDFVLGRPADRDPTTYEAMFLPDILRVEVERRLGVAPVTIYERRGPPFTGEPAGGRWILIALALVLAAAVAASRVTGRFPRLALATAAGILGFIGLVLWLLAMVSPLPEARWNEALLVFLPTDLVLPFLSERRLRRYARFRVTMLVVVSVLAAVGLLHQPLFTLILVPFLPLAAVGATTLRRRLARPVSTPVEAQGSDAPEPAVSGDPGEPPADASAGGS
jgi:hypothetical protein